MRVALFCTFMLAITAVAQERYQGGPFKGFLAEHPTLDVVEIPKLFKVRVVQGRVRYGQDTPVAELYFELRDGEGKMFTATTNESGTFQLPDVPPGTYDFKTTKDQFHSAVGKVVVSPKAPKDARIEFQVSLGT